MTLAPKYSIVFKEEIMKDIIKLQVEELISYYRDIKSGKIKNSFKLSLVNKDLKKGIKITNVPLEELVDLTVDRVIFKNKIKIDEDPMIMMKVGMMIGYDIGPILEKILKN